AGEWVRDLAAQGRLAAVDLAGERRYLLAEHLDAYHRAFAPAQAAPEPERDNARRAILRRCLSTHGPLTRDWLLARYPWAAAWLDPALAALVDSGELVHGHITNLPTSQATNLPVSQPQYCDRRNLERIHRQTLALLRKEVQPVSLYAYADFLARWQHLHPARRLEGPGALVRLLQQMRGVPAPGAIWERDLLPGRLADYHPAELEALCAGGEVVWVASGGADPRRARVRFFFRGEGSLFLPEEPDEPDLSPAAVRVLDFLKAEGASFFADLQAGVELAAEDGGSGTLAGALVELVLAGLVTNDSLHALRQVLSWSATDEGGERRPLSALEAELAAWRRSQQVTPRPVGRPAARASGRGQDGAGGWRHRPSRARMAQARENVARRLDRQAQYSGPAAAERSGEVEAEAPAGAWPGRWSLVHRFGVWGRPVLDEERIARQARQLLQSYGIVTRQSLEVDPEGAWDWGALYRQYQLMEMRGEVRRGYFVQGLPGVQFALPEAVERLREWTRAEAPGGDDLVLVNATDPANLFGPALDGAGSLEDDGAEPVEPDTGQVPAGLDPAGSDPGRFMRIPANYVVLLRGRPVLLIEPGAERLTTLPDLPAE
ncbi:MAG: hypothetical protein ACK2U9_23780, partial [Anaerolineae bacterium]